MQVNISHGHPLATFKCERCGFTYSRRGPDQENSDIYKKTYIKDFGHIWIEKLKEYADQEYSLRKMSRLLGFNGIGTIKRYVEIIKLNGQPEHKTKLKPEIKTLTDALLLVKKYKNLFLDIFNNNPEMNASKLHNKYKFAYELVSNYDRNWVKKTLLKKDEPKPSNKDRLKMYWKTKDAFYSIKILKSLEEIKLEQEFYVRITITLLQKYINHYNLYINRYKLPKCFEIFDKECETIPDYQKRRINYVMRQMADNSKRITFSKILYNAGLKNRASQKVLNYIHEKLNEYNQGNVIE